MNTETNTLAVTEAVLTNTPADAAPVRIDVRTYADWYLKSRGMSRAQRRKALREHGLLKLKPQ